MAERFLIKKLELVEGAPPTENMQKKIKRDAELQKQKEEALVVNKKKRAEVRHALKMRTYKYEAEYRKNELALIQARRDAKKIGGFYREAEPKVIFAMRIRGINKIPPKPKLILRLFRLLQLHNGVFIKVNKATIEMLKAIQPYITYGTPSLKSIRTLIYKRGYAKIGKRGLQQRVRLQSNDLVEKELGHLGLHGVEDVIHEIATCGPNFKLVSNFLWPFKLKSPRHGFVAKRHGFNEPRGGDWGDRLELINELLNRMM
eukprot:GHVT01055052.1.p1 GENE.GHVT01055052.1~~GHVT01055052.1.p1  ORF type:complete len:259 (+),score=60.32 GHVT01055052.1:173-949(+)